MLNKDPHRASVSECQPWCSMSRDSLCISRLYDCSSLTCWEDNFIKARDDLAHDSFTNLTCWDLTHDQVQSQPILTNTKATSFSYIHHWKHAVTERRSAQWLKASPTCVFEAEASTFSEKSRSEISVKISTKTFHLVSCHSRPPFMPLRRFHK